MSDWVNIARHLPAVAASAPRQAAVVVSKRRGHELHYQSLTYAELESLCNRYANGLQVAGIGRGMRTLLMVRQGFDFMALVFALFKMGAVPVLIDPGMGVSRLLECIRSVKLDAFIGIPIAQLVRVLRPGSFQGVRSFVTVGRRLGWSGATLGELIARVPDQFEPAATAPSETAAILFTSGSTGPAKGVVYEHGMFDAQIRMIQSTYGIEPGEIDLPTFPLFALFSVAMGMTIVLPDMDPSHPARVRPENIVEAIEQHRVTNTFGSPALWRRVGAHCQERGIKLPTLRRMLIAGAPVPPELITTLHNVLGPDADVHTPYGATESLPVSTISGQEVTRSNYQITKLPNHQISESTANRQSRIDNSGPTRSLTLSGAGTCVGSPVEGTRVRVIRVSDEPIETWSDELAAPQGEVGEICASGPAITKEYFNLPRANALAKINDSATVWHRIGDVGYFDEQGRLWFCGRKAHRVTTARGTLFTECIEAIFNQHTGVARCALVGVGSQGTQMPAVVVEPKGGRWPRGARARERFAAEIVGRVDIKSQFSEFRFEAGDCTPLKVAQRQRAVLQAAVGDQQLTILFHRSLPVDIRHNAKINREQLAKWAARRLAI